MFFQVNIKEQGRLLRQDEFLVWQGKSKKALRHVFLFEDLILFSKARRDPECNGHDYYQYKHSIKVSEWLSLCLIKAHLCTLSDNNLTYYGIHHG